MRNASLPSIGFDRYIELSWADYALDLAASGGDAELLKEWLYSHIKGAVSARKTFNQLNNHWLNSFQETEQIRAKALLLVPRIAPQDRIVLHWGMALANFELFQRTTMNMGKLLRLQGGFNIKEIQQRMAEVYSNQETIRRAVSRIIQSLFNWKVIIETKKNTYKNMGKIIIEDENLLLWLLQAILSRYKDHPVITTELLRLPELFPFDISENGKRILKENSSFITIREGLNQEFVVLR